MRAQSLAFLVVALLLGSRWINNKTETRSDVPHNMIYPLKDTRPNLHFLTGVLVKHVTFDECVSFDVSVPLSRRAV